jgi:hypothetical protein
VWKLYHDSIAILREALEGADAALDKELGNVGKEATGTQNRLINDIFVLSILFVFDYLFLFGIVYLLGVSN